ncbi:MAG: type II toxin-antitoxin system VapC family toxin [Acidobacteria bacterium]|nr:type II toxin-antitoxin system VapC family toxin [Acidobacteriota bacterium]
MSKYIFLDSGPLGLLVNPTPSPEVEAVMERIEELSHQGVQFHVPAIIYYEIKREFLRAGKTRSIARLDGFIAQGHNRYVPLTDTALRLAAELWAMKRQAGEPTAGSRNIDADIILAAQVLTFGAPAEELVVATTNPRHFTKLVEAKSLPDLL